MDIYPHTKISEIIRANQDAVEAIASLSKPLGKLKTPLLRRMMASRVSIAQAAVMGSCEITDLAAALRPLGFNFVDDAVTLSPDDPQITEDRPGWLTGQEASDVFDVRPVIEAGSDPLQAILQRYKELPEGNTICIINSFIPYPLIHLLESKGAEIYTETETPELHRSYFYKKMSDAKREASVTEDKKSRMADPGQIIFNDKAAFDRVMEQCDGQIWKKTDVRNLEMPQPMHVILGGLEGLPPGRALYIQHKRVPVFLLEALENQPYKIHIYEVSEGDTRMLIIRE